MENVPKFHVTPSVREPGQVLKHPVLRLAPGGVDQLLRDPLLGHLVLDERQRRLVLADIVGHVPVPVDRQQVRVVLYKKFVLNKKLKTFEVEYFK